MEFSSFSDAANYILSLKNEAPGTYEVKVNADETSGTVKASSFFKDVLRPLTMTEGIYVSLDLSESSIEIGDHAFSDCSRLLKIILPKGLKEIGKGAFRHCTSLESVENLQDVNIGEDAFFGCYSLKIQKKKPQPTPSYANSTSFDSFLDAAKYIASLRNASAGLYSIKINDNETTRQVNACEILKSVFQFIKPSSGISVAINLSESTLEIKENAFAGCKSLEAIEIPATTECIGKNAFLGCSGLKIAMLHEGLKRIEEGAFANCSSLEAIEIPVGVKSLGKSAFSGCDKLETITLPEGLKEIGELTFSNCKSLKEIEIPKSVELIGKNALASCSSLKTVILLTGLKRIEESAFANCSSLKEIEIPASVEYIGENAFLNCALLKKVTLHEGLKKIRKYAFKNCSSLKEINFPASVEYIEKDAFLDTGLETVILPKGLKQIEDHAFDNWKSLKSIEVPASVKYIGKSAFSGCNKLETVTLSEGLKEIKGLAFSNCNSLKEIAIPKSVELIGYSAFSGCNELETVTLPEGLKEIKEYTFFDCKSLKEIKIPTSVEIIGEKAFSGCTDDCITFNEPHEWQAISNGVIIKKQTLFLVLPDKDFNDYFWLRADCKKTVTNYFTGKTFFSFYETAKYISSLNTVGTYEIKIRADENAEMVNACLILKDALNHISSQNVFISLDLSECTMEIGDNAFAECSSLKEINIPVSVQVIGNWAFGNSKNKKSCSSLETVILHEGLKEIGAYAFYGCESLKSIEIPASVQVIGAWAFGGEPYTYNPSLETVILHEGLKEIKRSAFYGCKSLKSLEIPVSVESIEQDVFTNCFALENIYFKESNEWEALLLGCFEKTVTLSSVKGNSAISDFSIYYWHRTENKNTQQKIAHDSSFAGKIFYSFSDAAKYIDSLNKAGTYEIKIKANEKAELVNACGVLQNALYHISSPYIFVSLDLSECIMDIGSNAFSCRKSLKSIEIPASVETIGDYAFYGCPSLEKVILHEGLKEIRRFAFCICPSLKSIYIPTSVKSIGERAFDKSTFCQSLN